MTKVRWVVRLVPQLSERAANSRPRCRITRLVISERSHSTLSVPVTTHDRLTLLNEIVLCHLYPDNVPQQVEPTILGRYQIQFCRFVPTPSSKLQATTKCTPITIDTTTTATGSVIMDSMRSLNTSLPTSTQTRSSQPPEQLLQAFKTAALSVTNLYKYAVSDQNQARQSGYQDALDDLLSFLDKENLGLGDGEGWQVRQWATERLDKTNVSTAASDSDDDRGEIEKRARSLSPVLPRKQSAEALQTELVSRPTSPTRLGSAPPLSSNPTTIAQSVSHPILPDPDHPSTTIPFTFTANASLPQSQDIDMQAHESLASSTTSAPSPLAHAPPTASTPSVRLEVRNMGSRPSHRHSGPSNKHGSRSIGRDMGVGAGGTKRKLQFPDFFDISSIGNGKDSVNGGSKRSRFT